MLAILFVAVGSADSTAEPGLEPDPTLAADLKRHYDLVVYGATPGGVACALRAAREGLDVLLVSHSAHLGGMLVNGLSTMDTLYNGARAPIYDELRKRIYEDYSQRYGKQSPQFQAANPQHPKTRYEAHVAERLIGEMLAAESRITLLTGYFPLAAAGEQRLLATVTFRQMDSSGQVIVRGTAFADCSYEADLAATAGVSYRIGRESKQEFNEPHAGVIYMRRVPWPPAHVATIELEPSRRLNLVRYSEWYETIPEPSTGAADPSVQGFNMRAIVTRDPENRLPIPRPADYNPDDYRRFGWGNAESPGLSMPNSKFGLNEPKLVGKQDPYVEGDWEVRQAVTRLHCQASLGLLYFRQNDPSVPMSVRWQWQQYGLPRDEFVDNDHLPYEIYARETRRIRGRAVFTEHDAQLADQLARAPIHSSSISITEWFLDSHACTPRQVPGGEMEGMVMLKNQTYPGQVSYQTMLPEGLDNLVVPVCLSATHIGWGTIRLEPTWMSLGEAAGFAVTLASQEGVPLARIDEDQLVRRLADRGVMVSFFNDVEGCQESNWYSSVQYLGTQGFFGSYDARPQEALRVPLAETWIEHFRLRAGSEKPDASSTARLSWAAERRSGAEMNAGRFAARLAESVGWPAGRLDPLLQEWEIPSTQPICRGDACRLLMAAADLVAAGDE